MNKRVTVLGATGSIGDSTLDIVSRHGDMFQITALTANRNVEKLIAVSKTHQPALAVIGDPSLYAVLKDGLAGTNIAIAAGEEALEEAAEAPADIVISAIVGAAALKPTLAAIKKGRTIALANKECLVCAGDMVMQAAKKYQAPILPVDSEHNAIYQVFDQERPQGVRRLILTASGGPFRNRDIESLKRVSPQEAVAHPNWDMGAKISIDSATMMNKGLEVIEAYHLFPVRHDQIDVVVHPQSIIHSMVEYEDSSVLSQMGVPDMRTPIAYALAWPERMDAGVPSLDLAMVGRLDFDHPDYNRFPCLKLAKEALEAGGGATLALNAANEIAVASFLAGEIGFLDIAAVVGTVLQNSATKPPQSLDTVMAADSDARLRAKAFIKTLIA